MRAKALLQPSYLSAAGQARYFGNKETIYSTALDGSRRYAQGSVRTNGSRGS